MDYRRWEQLLALGRIKLGYFYYTLHSIRMCIILLQSKPYPESYLFTIVVITGFSLTVQQGHAAGGISAYMKHIVHTGRFVYQDHGDVHGSLGIESFEFVVVCHLIFLKCFVKNLSIVLSWHTKKVKKDSSYICIDLQLFP